MCVCAQSLALDSIWPTDGVSASRGHQAAVHSFEFQTLESHVNSYRSGAYVAQVAGRQRPSPHYLRDYSDDLIPWGYYGAGMGLH